MSRELAIFQKHPTSIGEVPQFDAKDLHQPFQNFELENIIAMPKFDKKDVDKHALTDAAASRANALKQKFKSFSNEPQYTGNPIGKITAPLPRSKWLIIAIVAAGTLGLFIVG